MNRRPSIGPRIVRGLDFVITCAEASAETIESDEDLTNMIKKDQLSLALNFATYAHSEAA